MMFGSNSHSDETWKRIPQDSVGVELGVWKGQSSEKFLRKAKQLHLVDPWRVTAYEDSDEFGDYNGYLERYSKLVGSKNPDDFQKYYDRICEQVRTKFKDKNVVVHRKTTDEFFNEFKEKVDWVYVDALHSFDGCLNDLRNSVDIIKEGGIIFGDDYSDKKPGVKKAVDVFVKEKNLLLNVFYKDQYEIQL